MVSTPRRSSTRPTSPSKKVIASHANKKPRYCRKCPDVPQHEQRLCPRYKRSVRVPDTDAVLDETSSINTGVASNSVSTASLDTTGTETPAIDPTISDNTASNANECVIDPALFSTPEPPTTPARYTLPSTPPIDSSPVISTHTPPALTSSLPEWSAETPTRSQTSTPNTPSSSVGRSSPIGNLLHRRRARVSSTPGTPTRLRASVRNPVFGTIIGAYRGSRVIELPRTRPLGTVRNRKVTKHFQERLRALLTRCEDLSHETGCWLHLSAQLPTSNVPFTHFTSERLRAEGGAILDEIHDASDRLYDSLTSARRRDNAQLASDVRKANQEREAALARAAQMEETLRAAGLPIP